METLIFFVSLASLIYGVGYYNGSRDAGASLVAMFVFGSVSFALFYMVLSFLEKL